MPFEKGHKKYGGKKKGYLKNHSAHEIAERLKCSPFEVLCHFANGDWKALGYDAECYFKETESGAVKLGYVVSPDMRLQAAKEASKYLYAQRRAIEMAPDQEQTEINDQVRDLASWYKNLKEMT
jgi:hypothetical protein